MSKDMANMIMSLVDNYVDKDNIYSFNKKVYCKSSTTSIDEFVKHMMKENIKKCIKLLFNSENLIAKGIVLDHGINIIDENMKNRIVLFPFHFTHDEFDDLVNVISDLFKVDYDCKKCTHLKTRSFRTCAGCDAENTDKNRNICIFCGSVKISCKLCNVPDVITIERYNNHYYYFEDFKRDVYSCFTKCDAVRKLIDSPNEHILSFFKLYLKNVCNKIIMV